MKRTGKEIKQMGMRKTRRKTMMRRREREVKRRSRRKSGS